MRLFKARIQKYRSIRDTGEFEVESEKTILVGPNEAGKSVILQALQQLNPPEGIDGFRPLRDYPRSEYNKDIDSKTVDPDKLTVVEGHFELEPDDLEKISSEYKECTVIVGRNLDNSSWSKLDGGPTIPTFGKLKKDFTRLCAHIDGRCTDEPAPSVGFKEIICGWSDSTSIADESAKKLKEWLEATLHIVDEENPTEETRYDLLCRACSICEERTIVLTHLMSRIPLFVLFNNYFRVRPRIHLEHLADRQRNRQLDDEQYDYGNLCLLKFLGFSAQELADLGNAPKPCPGDVGALEVYQANLD